MGVPDFRWCQISGGARFPVVPDFLGQGAKFPETPEMKNALFLADMDFTIIPKELAALLFAAENL